MVGVIPVAVDLVQLLSPCNVREETKLYDSYGMYNCASVVGTRPDAMESSNGPLESSL